MSYRSENNCGFECIVIVSVSVSSPLYSVVCTRSINWKSLGAISQCSVV